MIVIRRALRRRSRRAAWTAIAVVVGLLVVHHAGLLHEGHTMRGDTPTMHHGDAAPASTPAGDDGGVLAMCLAVLPALVALAITAGVLLPRRSWLLRPHRRLVSAWSGGAHLFGPARTGPHVLCVVRC